MKTIVHDRYGSPAVLTFGEVEQPQPTDEQVLVRVRASSINAYDWHMLRGKPYIARLSEGFWRPKTMALGLDVAGVVEAVGAKVADLRPGDNVYGSRTGAFAEYVAGRNMVPMPAGLTFEQAAAVPVAGQTALQGLRDKGGLRAGQRLLVIGAGGGVGTFAVQIGKAFGTDVTAVTSPQHLELIRSLGADRVVDYTRDDFTRAGERYDVILDIGGRQRLSRLHRSLTSDGVVVMVAPQPGQWVGPVARVAGATIGSRFRRQKVRPFLSTGSRDDLLLLKELIEAGKIRPVIDRTYPFDQVPEAIRYVEAGNARGKVVIAF